MEAEWFAVGPASVDLHPQRPQGTAVCVGGNKNSTMIKRYLNIKCLKAVLDKRPSASYSKIFKSLLGIQWAEGQSLN